MIKVRHIRIDDKIWAKLEKEAPESVSALVRSILRNYFETKNQTRTPVGK